MLSNPSEITDEPSPSWRAIEDTGAGDGLPSWGQKEAEPSQLRRPRVDRRHYRCFQPCTEKSHRRRIAGERRIAAQW